MDARLQQTDSASAGGKQMRSELRIRNTRREDSRLYACLARNAFGSDESLVQLLVQEAPDPPVDVRVSDVRSRSLTVSWTPGFAGNSPVAAFRVSVARETEPEWRQEGKGVTSSVTGSETETRIQGLQPNSRYAVRVSAGNSVGWSGASSPATRVTTDEEAPAGPPTHVKALAVSSRSLRVSWSPVRADLASCARITGYYLSYRRVAQQSQQQQTPTFKTISLASAAEAEANQSVLLTGLDRASVYAVSVQAFGARGAGPASEAIQVATLTRDPPSKPLLTSAAADASSVTLAWRLDPPTLDAASPVATDHEVQGFVVRQRRLLAKSAPAAAESAREHEWQEVKVSSSLRSLVMQRLACGSSYQFSLQAFNSVGVSPPSDLLTARTLGSLPLAPIDSSFVHANLTACSLKLPAWRDAGCPIARFTLRLSNPDDASSNRSFTVYETQQPFVLSDLTPGSRYRVRVTASSEAGDTSHEYTCRPGVTVTEPEVQEEARTFATPAFVLDLRLLLPATVSLLTLLLLIFTVKACVDRKRHQLHAFYGLL